MTLEVEPEMSAKAPNQDKFRHRLRTTLGMLFFIPGVIGVFYTGWLLLVFWFSSLTAWLGGFFGFVVGIVFTPGMLIFPGIYWLVEGVFPMDYFILLLEGIACMLVTALGVSIAGWSD